MPEFDLLLSKPIAKEYLIAVADRRKVDQSRVRVSKDDAAVLHLTDQPLQFLDELDEPRLRALRVSVAPHCPFDFGCKVAYCRPYPPNALKLNPDLGKNGLSLLYREVLTELLTSWYGGIV